MLGLVLAAGSGKRLRPVTDGVPKALVPLGDGRTILDVTLHNLAAAGLDQVVVVVGYAADAVVAAQLRLESEHAVTLHLVHNDRFEQWNNAYSLWCARDLLPEGALLVNGDTLHPAHFEERLLGARGAGLVLALDEVKTLGEEEMKVRLHPDRSVARITKSMAPAEADGEYLGLTLIETAVAADLTEALEATWRRDPSLYYEDGFQHYADRGGTVSVVAVGAETDWVEVDDLADLERARGIACHC